MLFPGVTAGYAAILALIYVGLSAWVVAGRAKYRVNHGDGGTTPLARRIRAHANFIEYVPLILLLVALLEGNGASHASVHALLFILVVARLMHPVGMVAPDLSRQQFAFRGTSAFATWIILVVSAVLLLIRVV